MPLDPGFLSKLSFKELQKIASEMALPVGRARRRHDLLFLIARSHGEKEGSTYGHGILEVHSEGFGFLRSPESDFLPSAEDIYVSQSQIRRFLLKTGDAIIGIVRAPKEGERYNALLRVEFVNGEPPGSTHPAFEQLTVIHPDDLIDLSKDPLWNPIHRIAPLGLGHRGLWVAPPRTHRLELEQSLVSALSKEPELDVTLLLLASTPEEIQEWKSNSPVEVVATPFDEPAARHIQVAEIVFERARRMVERGDDVVLIVDSLSRLLRAYLAELPSSGREFGGIDATALHRIRRLLGAARALEEGGSLTIVALTTGDSEHRLETSLIEDLREVVNWELTCHRELADRGYLPPVDVGASGTRRPEKLLAEAELQTLQAFRSSLSGKKFEDCEALFRIESGNKKPKVRSSRT